MVSREKLRVWLCLFDIFSVIFLAYILLAITSYYVLERKLNSLKKMALTDDLTVNCLKPASVVAWNSMLVHCSQSFYSLRFSFSYDDVLSIAAEVKATKMVVLLMEDHTNTVLYFERLLVASGAC